MHLSVVVPLCELLARPNDDTLSILVRVTVINSCEKGVRRRQVLGHTAR
jgi:hypothetical protein